MFAIALWYRCLCVTPQGKNPLNCDWSGSYKPRARWSWRYNLDLESERVRLRQWVESDVPGFIRLNSNPDVTQYFPG